MTRNGQIYFIYQNFEDKKIAIILYEGKINDTFVLSFRGKYRFQVFRDKTRMGYRPRKRGLPFMFHTFKYILEEKIYFFTKTDFLTPNL
jgi:hypothetical protein